MLYHYTLFSRIILHKISMGLALPEQSNLTQILAPLSSLMNKHIVLSIFLKLQVCLIFQGCVTKNATEKVEWCKWLLTYVYRST